MPLIIIRKRQLKAITGLSPRHIDRLEKSGDFPSRIQLSPRAVGWLSDEVENWVKNRQRGMMSPPSELSIDN